MGKLLAILLLSSPLVAQQIIQVPPSPTCKPLFAWDACQSQWNQWQQAMWQYNEAVTQQREKKQQQDAAQTTKDLQLRIDFQNEEIKSLFGRIKNLTDQMAADVTEADRDKTEALEEGILYGFLGTLVLLALGYSVRRFSSVLLRASRFRLRIVRTTE
jgi:2-succinyl-5-enolpyruvyl-6-hydroxy-3-cyclohexene-1-carboxylate synthase